MKIVIAGGSGQVGTLLARYFHREGHAVVVLSRREQSAAWQTRLWNGENLGPWAAELEASDVLINLAGRSVNCRYDRENRRQILDSRVRSTRVLHRALAGLSRPPAVWLNASTATIYRHALDRPMDEATGELGARSARHMELLHSGRKGLGGGVPLDSHRNNAAGRPAQRDDLQRRS